MKLYLVDAFTDQLFTGNPAGVCFLDKDYPGSLMQNIATELNQAESAFVVDLGDCFHLRWFTPLKEIVLCGHATLATAHMIWSKGIRPESETLQFDTLSGRLTATKRDGKIQLDFPVDQTLIQAIPSQVLADYGIHSKVLSAAKTRLGWIVEFASDSDLKSFEAHTESFGRLGLPDLILTAKSTDPRYDIVSRFFAPSLGIPEDPVTGAAHCALADFWFQKTGMKVVRAFQASKRGGHMVTELDQDRVRLLGNALTLFEGMIENI
jgi:predicted PhzF superfamily epimerase YddE/YHI9